jgi:nucleoside-diphosphate-sugar epimerase
MRCEDLAGNIADEAFWEIALPGADFVFHFAAQTSAYVADKNPAVDFRANVLPMLALLEVCRVNGHHPMILFPATATQFGAPDLLPVDESQPDRPLTIYDCHKIIAENYLEHYARQGWARGVALRLANIYGPGPVGGSPDRGVLNMMMRRAVNWEPITIYGAGDQIRDYLYVLDAVEAFLAAALHSEYVNGKHFVIASGKGHTLAQAFELVAERTRLLTGKPVSVVHLAPPPGLSRVEDRDFIGNFARFNAATGWTPHIMLREGLDRTLKSFLKSNNRH